MFAKEPDNLVGLSSIRVVGRPNCVHDPMGVGLCFSDFIEHISGWNGQLPPRLSTEGRQVYKRLAINLLLILRDGIDESKLPRNMIGWVAEQGKP